MDCVSLQAVGDKAAMPPPGGRGAHLEDAGVILAQVLVPKVLPGHAEASAGGVQPAQPIVAAAVHLAQEPVPKAQPGASPVDRAGEEGGRRATGQGPGTCDLETHLSGRNAMASSARHVVRGDACDPVVPVWGSQTWTRVGGHRSARGWTCGQTWPLNVTTDVAVLTREVTGVEPASGPGQGFAGRTLRRQDRPVAEKRNRSARGNET